MEKAETVYRTKTIKVGCATVRIHQPVLTETERKRVEADIVSALSRFGKVLEGERKDEVHGQ